MRSRFSRRVGITVALTALYAAVLWVFARLQIGCVFNTLLGFPCPGCGMSRAWLSVLHMDLAQAIRFHPMFWSVPILYGYILFDGKLLRHKAVDAIVLGLIALGFLLSWVWRLGHGFP